MVAALILAFSVLALLQFAVSQWRLIWFTTANQPISENLRATAGIDEGAIRPGDFGALLKLCDELSPDIREATPWLRELRCYYGLLSKMQRACASLVPSLAKWTAGEMAVCSRYVAVVLDQNLALDVDRRAAARSV
jgi:hypothetical protein